MVQVSPEVIADLRHQVEQLWAAHARTQAILAEFLAICDQEGARLRTEAHPRPSLRVIGGAS